MGIAEAVSKRGSCPRRQVGAVLVRGGHVIATGYNGSPSGIVHCITAGCDIEHGHCVRAIHAEANALIQAGVAGAATSGTTLYTTASPCRYCMGLIINAGVKRVVYGDVYKDPTHMSDSANWAFNAAEALGIEMFGLARRPDPEGREALPGDSWVDLA